MTSEEQGVILGSWTVVKVKCGHCDDIDYYIEDEDHHILPLDIWLEKMEISKNGVIK